MKLQKSSTRTRCKSTGERKRKTRNALIDRAAKTDMCVVLAFFVSRLVFKTHFSFFFSFFFLFVILQCNTTFFFFFGAYLSRVSVCVRVLWGGLRWDGERRGLLCPSQVTEVTTTAALVTRPHTNSLLLLLLSSFFFFYEKQYDYRYANYFVVVVFFIL